MDIKPELYDLWLDRLLQAVAEFDPLFDMETETAWRRVLLQPTMIGGVEIPAGARLLLALGSANRDEKHFEGGECFDIQRENARDHLTFGFGRHHCLGHDLARMEMRVILEELTRRLPTLTLAPAQNYQYSANTSHRGPEHVLVHWVPR